MWSKVSGLWFISLKVQITVLPKLDNLRHNDASLETSAAWHGGPNHYDEGGGFNHLSPFQKLSF